MAERIVKGYKRLFEVRLLHHYWLDIGNEPFGNVIPAAISHIPLRDYDVRQFLAVEPTDATKKLLSGLSGVFKTSGLGFVVAVPDGVLVPADAVFEFAVKVVHSDFFNYTSLTMRKRQISQIYHQPTDRLHRYKSGVYVFSNSTGVIKGGVIYLSGQVPNSGPGPYPAEGLFDSGGQLYQANRDITTGPPSASWQLINSQITWPIYVHQHDVPSITPPAGMTGAPERGIELTEGLPDDIFALIRIVPLMPGEDKGLFTTAGALLEPVFEIRFKNRSTHQDYLSKQTGDSEPIPSLLLPMTHFGNAGTGQKPTVGGVKAQLSATDEIERIFTEIFI